MDYGTRRCGKCSQIKLIQDLVPCGENCLFGTDGVSTICYDCALESINIKDLTMVDKLCQFLDIAFMADNSSGMLERKSSKFFRIGTIRASFASFVNEIFSYFLALSFLNSPK